MLWTELLFTALPIGREKFGQQMVARFCFLFLVWLTGLAAYALDGLTIAFVSNLQILLTLFFMGFMVLFGSYMIQRSLHDVILSFRPLLKLDDSQFLKLAQKVERYSYSIVPCLLIGLVLSISVSSLHLEFQTALVGGLRLYEIWNLLFIFFFNLLSATAIWFGVAIWLTIYYISKQPLKVELSPTTIEKFRGLTMLAWNFSLFYFLANLVGMVLTVTSDPTMPLLEMFVSPFLLFIAIGVVSVLYPFYNIHKTLFRLKKQELLKIEGVIGQLRQRLDEILEKQAEPQSSDQTIATMGRLLSLQIKEGQVKQAQEWPIDITFLSKLGGLVLVPIIGKLALELLTRYF